MNARWMLVLLLVTGAAVADDATGTKPAPAKAKQEPAKAKDQPAKAKDDKAGSEAPDGTKDAPEKPKDDSNLGMSILGNQEAPKALVIVPWKSSELGQSLGVSTLLDDSRQPIDKEVFMRMLTYYGIRTNTTLPDATQPATPAHRRKS